LINENQAIDSDYSIGNEWKKDSGVIVFIREKH